MRAGLPDRRADARHRARREPARRQQGFDREVDSVCPFCGVGCQVKFKIKDDKIRYVDGGDGPANENRLCVKGRFGFDYIHHPHRLTKPLIRKRRRARQGAERRPGEPLDPFPRSDLGRGAGRAAGGLRTCAASSAGAVAGFGSAKCSNEEAYLFQKLIRTGFGHNNVDHCTRLCHASSVAALMENVGSGAVTATFNEIENADVAIVIGANPTENHPVAATYFKQFAKRGGELIVMDPRGRGAEAPRHPHAAVPPRHRRAMLNAIMHVIVRRSSTTGNMSRASPKASSSSGPPEEVPAREDGRDLRHRRRDDPRTVARKFANGQGGMIFWGMGVSSTSTAPTIPAA
jgi:formate dehydrogenase major subunit